MPRLARDYRLIAPDLRGHGRSGHGDDYSWGAYAADLEALLDLSPRASRTIWPGNARAVTSGWSFGQRVTPTGGGRRLRDPSSVFAGRGGGAVRHRPTSPPSVSQLEHGARSYSRALGSLATWRTLARDVFRQNDDGCWSAPADPRTLEIEPFRTYELAARLRVRCC